jgi:hypothetical protein
MLEPIYWEFVKQSVGIEAEIDRSSSDGKRKQAEYGSADEGQYSQSPLHLRRSFRPPQFVGFPEGNQVINDPQAVARCTTLPRFC